MPHMKITCGALRCQTAQAQPVEIKKEQVVVADIFE